MFDPTAQQVAILEAARTGDNLVVIAVAGSGKTSTLRLLGADRPSVPMLYVAYNKALRNDQPVLTPGGWAPIGSMKVGDQVIGKDGKAHGVKKVHPRGIRPMFEVVFSDGTVVVADEDHLWLTQTITHEARLNKWRIRTTQQLADTVHQNHRVPHLDASVEMPHRTLPLSPYLLGALLGDGSFRYHQVLFSCAEPDLAKLVEMELPEGHTLNPQKDGGRERAWLVSSGRGGFPKGRNKVMAALREFGLQGHGSRDKFVPDSYLYSSAEQRLALLQGLMDTDGCANGSQAIYVTTSKRLAEQVVYLSQSLGGSASTYAARGAYWVNVRISVTLCPFRLQRKVDAWRPRTRDAQTSRKIVEIRPVSPAEATCISIDSEDHLFVTAGCILTHNSIQLDAQGSFTPNVECRTAHSLAWGGTVGKYGDRVRKARMGALPVKDVQAFCNLYQPFDWDFESELPELEGKELAELVARTIGRFITSADFEINDRHATRPAGLPEKETAYLLDEVVRLARLVWDDLSAVKGQLTFNPDIYLKLWQLSRPVLRKYKVIFLDEAQDANRAMADVFERQTHAQLIAVGDPCQEIYGWRGAANAMARWDWPRLGLTKSFRFGPAIAAQANRWLDFLGAEMRVEGFDKLASSIGELTAPDAILCRTNIGVVDAALRELAAGRKVAVVGGIGDVLRLARAAINLKAGRRANHPDLAAFRSWDEFLAFVADDPDGEQFRVLVALVEIYGPDEILYLGNRLTAKEADADVTISTGHKSKGREWDEVVIGPDFAPRDSDSEDDPTPAFTREAAMLAYVCTTRAKLALDPGPLGDVPV